MAAIDNFFMKKPAEVQKTQQTQQAGKTQNANNDQDRLQNNSIFNYANNSFGQGNNNDIGDTIQIGNTKKNNATGLSSDNKKTDSDKKTDETKNDDKTKETDKDKKLKGKLGKKEDGKEKVNADKKTDEPKANMNLTGATDEAEDTSGKGLNLTSDVKGNDNKELLDLAKKIQSATGNQIVKEGNSIDVTSLKMALESMDSTKKAELTKGKEGTLKSAGVSVQNKSQDQDQAKQGQNATAPQGTTPNFLSNTSKPNPADQLKKMFSMNMNANV